MRYFQVQDKVDRDTVLRFRGNCDRIDCSISARWEGERTCMGSVDFYDYTGKMVIEEPNDGLVNLCCIVCGKCEQLENKE